MSILFQSTRPMRGATRAYQAAYYAKNISIHAPHAGRDVVSSRWSRQTSLFQSTRPMRGATEILKTTQSYYSISIHAPHAGRD